MDTARLRRTFRYPADEDDGTDLLPEEMDEEEQEHLLADLQASEVASNRQYTLILTALPLVAVLPFLRYTITSTTASMAMLCLLSITSLLASAYIMYYIPIGSGTDSTSTSNLTSTSPSTTTATSSRRTPSSIFGQTSAPAPGRPYRLGLPTLPLPLLFSDMTSGSPIVRFLPTLNAAIGVLLFLASMVYRSKSNNNTRKMRSDAPEGFWLVLVLPPTVFLMVYFAKRSMRDVQAGLSELQALRYDYKGA